MYTKFFKRKKLINYWTFYNGSLIYSFKSNYELLNIFSGNFCFIGYQQLLLNIKKTVFLLNTISVSQILIISGIYIFSKNLTKLKNFSIFNEVKYQKLGLFCNFYMSALHDFKKMSVNKNLTISFFFNVDENRHLVEESKKKEIISIGLTSTKSNSLLVDYPITLNLNYFYSSYFFTKLFFKALLAKKMSF